MKLLAATSLVVIGFLGTAAYAAMPLAGHPGPTVNNYTADQARRAEEAARREGFQDIQIAMVQDGNFFLTGQKNGMTYGVTVTRDGKVYSSSQATQG